MRFTVADHGTSRHPKKPVVIARFALMNDAIERARREGRKKRRHASDPDIVVWRHPEGKPFKTGKCVWSGLHLGR